MTPLKEDPVKMALWVSVMLTVLQLCRPTLLLDPQLYISLQKNGLDTPSKPWMNPLLMDVLPSIEVSKPATQTETSKVKTDPKSQSMFGENINLKWVQWEGLLPDGTVAIYNGYTERMEYICKVNCEAGFYTASKGQVCHYPYAEKEYSSSKFEVLVNVDNFEFIEWVDDSHGSVPQHSIKTCPGVDIYVGKNKYGLGKVVPLHAAFFLPWEGDEYWYKSYQVLSINQDSYSQHISDVEYGIDAMELFHHSPEALQLTKTTNMECSSLTKNVLLEKTSTMEKTWDIGRETRNSSISTMTGKVPIISPGNLDFSKEQTVSFSEGTTIVETITHSISVQIVVPPNHSCAVRMEGRKMTADIPFKGRLSRTNPKGDTRWTTITGTYDGLRVGEINSVIERCKPIPDAVPCYPYEY